MRLCCVVLASPRIHPTTATLDVRSEGRLQVGLGAGWLRQEYEDASMPFERASVRIERLMPSNRGGRTSIDPSQFSAPAIEEEVGWIRDAAGSRFDDIELSAQLIACAVTDGLGDAGLRAARIIPIAVRAAARRSGRQAASRIALILARSLRLARRIAGAISGAMALEKPVGSPRLRNVIRVDDPAAVQV